MTWQSLSDLAQLPSASLTAVCSLAALSANPGRPDAPTATAFHPGPASLRATSPLASAAMEELLAASKETGDLKGGWYRHDKGVVDRHDHAGAAGKGTAGFERSAHRLPVLSPPV